MQFTDILDRFSIPYLSGGHHHCRPGWVQLDCEQCSPSWQHWRLGYNIEGHYCSCWQCGFRPVVKVLMELTGQSFHSLKELLSDLDRRRRGSDEEILKRRLILPEGIGPLHECQKKYLRGRGFDPEHLSKFWGVMGIGIAARLAWRILIPIHWRGQIVSWTTRAISDSGARYISASPAEERLSAKSLLFAADHARHAILICEGPLDVFKIGPGAVCTFGTSWTKAQVNQMARYPVRTICLDAEPAAQRRARELCRILNAFPGRTENVVLDTGKDPGNASKQEISSLRKILLD